MKTQRQISKPCLITCVLTSFLVGCTLTAHGAGVAAHKDQPFHADSMAKPIVYAKIISATPVDIRFDLGSRQVAFERGKIVANVEIPEQPLNIRNEAELDAVRVKYEEIKTFAERYIKCAELLGPYVAAYGKSIVKYNAGEVRYNGSWISRESYAAILKRQSEEAEMSRRREAQMQEEMRIQREKDEAFAKSQREKGLELYRNQWLPRAEALALQKNDREIAAAWEKVRSKSILGAVYSVFQVLDEGMLIKPYKGQLENAGINVDLAYLSGALESAAADGDYYKGDLYWCGNYSYLTKGGRDSTVNAYCLNKAEAVSRVRQMLFSDDEVSDERVVASSGKAEAEPELPAPLKGAKSSGSGFFVGIQGYFITNAHVVDDSDRVSIYYGGKMLNAEVVKVSKVVDLAILKVPQSVIGLEISSEEPQPGNDVFAIGYPQPALQGLEAKVTKGVISSSKGLDDDDTRFQIDAAVQPGNSGGPLCDSSGRVVGVVVAGLNQIAVASVTGSIPQNVNYGIKVAEVSALLRTKSIDATVPADNTQGSGSQANVIKVATSRTGLVIVK